MDARLNDVFRGVIGKRLSAVECISEDISKQHEIQVGGRSPELLGAPSDPVNYPCRFLYLSDDTPPIDELLTLNYGDRRRANPARTPEWRLTYRKSNRVMAAARAGDWCWVVAPSDDSSGESLTVIIAEAGSKAARQLDRLFDTRLTGRESRAPRLRGTEAFQQGDLFAATGLDVDDADLLALLGVSVSNRHENELDQLLQLLEDVERSETGWPSTRDFTSATRRLCRVRPQEDPDGAMVEWFETTNELFFAFERSLLQGRLDSAFANRTQIDIDLFLEVAKSVLNSRKSRAGTSFEEHLKALFNATQISFTHAARTSLPNGTRPDFLLPCRSVYLDPSTPDEVLAVLAAKTSAKERWLQILGEGTRDSARYMASMDRDLTRDQVTTMASAGVSPVLPRAYIERHYPWAGEDLADYATFLTECRHRERRAAELGIVVRG